jgi:hypothetical protein
MKECCKKESCGTEKSNCKCRSGEKCCRDKQKCCDSSHSFFEVADCAWREVLKEMIKDHIRSHDGDRMTELAKIIAESNGQRWKNKMNSKRHCKDLKEKLCGFFEKSKK